MNSAHPVTARALALFNERVRKLKKRASGPHHEAARQIARAAGFNDWEALRTSHDTWLEQRARFETLVVVAFDPRDARRPDYAWGMWQHDPERRHGCDDGLFYLHRRSINTHDPRARHETESLESSWRRRARRLDELVFLRYENMLLRPRDERFDLDDTYFDELPIEL